MLTLNGKKMSKSTGNNLLPEELFTGENNLLNKAFDPMVVRFFTMQAHYRSTLDFTSDALIAAKKGYDRLGEAYETLMILTSSELKSSSDVHSIIQSFYNAMNDDFNAPILLSNIFEAVKFINSIKDGKATIATIDLLSLQEEMTAFIFDVLGLKFIKAVDNSKLAGVMDLILDIRKNARESKDWATSDKIRDGLTVAGITVKDGKDGVVWN
jgi:cysteinyl-tRNA synthetase